jgi:hypothetical protein
MIRPGRALEQSNHACTSLKEDCGIVAESQSGSELLPLAGADCQWVLTISEENRMGSASVERVWGFLPFYEKKKQGKNKQMRF